MQNENLTTEIAAEAVDMVMPGIKEKLEKKLNTKISVYIVVVHPTVVIKDTREFDVLYEIGIGLSNQFEIMISMAKLNAEATIRVRDLYYQYPGRSFPYEPSIPIGGALKNGIIVGVYGMPKKQFNQAAADMIATMCDALCYQEDNSPF